MRYFVIADDGNRYGPADVPTLNQWIEDGRVHGKTMLQEETGGAIVAASVLPGLTFPLAQQAGPPSFANYPRGAVDPNKVDRGGSDIAASFGFAVFSLLMSMCGVFGLALGVSGIYIGNRAHKKGHPMAIVAIGLNALAIVVWVVARFFVGRLWRGH